MSKVIKTSGPWGKVNEYFKNFDKRLRYIESSASRVLCEALLEEVRNNIPQEDKFKQYRSSLEIVSMLIGSGKNTTTVYGIIAKPDFVQLSEVGRDKNANKMVVHISPAEGVDVDPMVVLISKVNPWPVDMVPHGIIPEQVFLVHRLVTRGEVEEASKRVEKHLEKHRDELRRYGYQVGVGVGIERPAGELRSLPDYLSLAIRAEFGINTDAQPHWRPAIEFLRKHAYYLLRENEKIEDCLYLLGFREHLMTQSPEYEIVDRTEFNKETKTFKEKVLQR